LKVYKIKVQDFISTETK